MRSPQSATAIELVDCGIGDHGDSPLREMQSYQLFQSLETSRLDVHRVAPQRVADDYGINGHEVNSSPSYVAEACAMIGQAREGEEQIRKAVEIHDEELWDVACPAQVDHTAFCPAADRPCQM